MSIDAVIEDAPGGVAGIGHAPLPPGQEPREAPASWWQTEQPREQVIEQTLALVFTASSVVNRRNRERGLTKLLDWLQDQPGQTWQDRWLISGAEDAGAAWAKLPMSWLARQGQARNYDRADLCCGMIPLLAGQVVRPDYRWLLRQRPSQLLGHLRRTLDPQGFAALQAHPALAGATTFNRAHALNRITWILTRKGGRIDDITVGDCVELQHAIHEHQIQGKGRHLFYGVLAERGVFGPAASRRLKALLLPGQSSPAQLVDRHRIASRPVRDLLVDYLSERAAELDYNSLEAMAGTLVGLFWHDLETHHPGIDTLRLPADVTAAWKERVRTIRDAEGRPVRARVNVHGVFNYVRAFYQDLARWAADDPARWGPWVAPCPVRAADCGHSKARLRRKASMDQRTRTLLPTLPALVDAVERQHRAAGQRLATARDLLAGAELTLDDGTRCRRRAGASDRVYVNDLNTGHRRDLTVEEDRAFWTKAIVDVLRHTGLRVEEMLELTHHSFIAYTLPTTGEIVPMLQVAPSKLDQERLLLVSPELGETLTAIIQRVRGGAAAVPVVSAYDTMEKTWSPPLPFLFQRSHGAEHRAISRNYIHKCLTQAVAASGLAGPDHQPLHYSPHDFRRLFLTDALRSGLPPHIAAKIAGHQMVDTTLGYAAIYPEDVINHHRAFIARRRALRPSHEYRELTTEEWDEFLAHFELRKVALGVCARDYGTPCQHEHACVRCPLLRPDPDQRPRLEEIRHNLHDRLAEAKDQGWLGEVAAIEASLTAAEQKLAVMTAADHGPTPLGMPEVRTSTGRNVGAPCPR